MSEFITVKSTKEDGKVVLWERNPEHPEGEVFISGDGKSHRVALTPEVALRLKDGVLVKTGEVAPEPNEAEKQAAQKKADAEAKAKEEAEARAKVEAEAQAAAQAGAELSAPGRKATKG